MAQRQFRSDDTDKWRYGFGNGADGALTISGATTDAPIDSACTGTAGATALSATNASFSPGQLVLIHQTRGAGAGNWELNKIGAYTAGTITLAHPLINSYVSGAQVLVLKQYTNVTINTGQTLTAKAWTGSVGGILAILASGTFTISGTGKIDAQGKNASAGTGGARMGFQGGNGQNQTGEGTAGDRTTGTAANGNGGGAGSAGNSTGGSGGHAAAGGNGVSNGGTGGTGGSAVGNAGLTSMNFGGGGGGGGNGGSSNGSGGGGGAIIFIMAKTISCAGSGVSTVNGGNGKKSSGGGVGGPGGAGGSVLFKGQVIALGTNLFTATGGANENGSVTSASAGSAGRIHVDYMTSLSGSTNPTLDSRQDATLDYVLGGGFLLNMLS